MKEIRWFTNSPNAGDPDCFCSWCGLVITECAVRLLSVDETREARFHVEICIGEALPQLKESVWASFVGDEQE